MPLPRAVTALRNLLFLSHRFPYPPNRGEKIRAFNLIRHLSKTWQVHLGCLSDDPADRAHEETLRQYCTDLAVFPIDKRRQKLRALLHVRPGRPLMLDYYRHEGLQRWVDAAIARVEMDILYVYSTAMMPYVERVVHPDTILDMVDVDSEKWRDYARRSSWPMRSVWAREGRTLLAYERSAAAASRQTLLVSEPEVSRFLELAPECGGRVTWIENGVDLDTFSPAQHFETPFPTPGPHIVFTGNMDYRPNADAVVWFATDILPTVQQRHPTAQFHIVGAGPGPEVQALARRPGVEVTGRVPDVRPYVAHAAAVVAPLRIARGIQNKVIEGMAMGRPVIASSEAAAGVRARPGRDLLTGGDAATIARLVIEVLSGEHPDLGAAGRRAVEAAYAWAGTLARFDRVLANALTETAAPETIG
ncbi:TIGR03087 family PEP-CTERM/XrtA system glycosyltransferase [Roseomonas sp. HJA6]|uniref:TIGR03087 family PEP-CTERM/XrtA system glycosyltransferase n=1 Tax=Roseomonas alba TaxID=2846776 RepID=A0ABS7A5F8_9PROT|nr:TIGR03087 family PEP-CTERM/XrtA system glycosyltransferase [Neoroseomonas alba]MBW6397528.1 TIGR03087 family PEP-CTERM/XrtA system glycosyltransferase [Neoroseomonas alba]